MTVACALPCTNAKSYLLTYAAHPMDISVYIASRYAPLATTIYGRTSRVASRLSVVPNAAAMPAIVTSSEQSKPIHGDGTTANVITCYGVDGHMVDTEVEGGHLELAPRLPL